MHRRFCRSFRSLFVVAVMFACVAGRTHADEVTTKPKESSEATSTELSREQRIVNYLTGSRFIGSYSIDSQGFGALKEEAYTISKVEKLPEADAYRLTARIQYGDTDGEFPMDLKILWAGNTPVITLDQVWIPGLGTFSARVLILKNRYSGTWDHDAVGGHLFGRIEKVAGEKAGDAK
jgi:hypothetical protein